MTPQEQFERQTNKKATVPPCETRSFTDDYVLWLEAVVKRQANETPRKEVLDFAIAMEKKLKRHDDRGGWQIASFEYLYSALLSKASALLLAKADLAEDLTKDEAVDIANFAMMIWDNYS